MKLLMVCDDRAELELCRTLLASAELAVEVAPVTGAVALAEAISAGPYGAIIIDVSLRFAPSSEVTELLLRTFDVPVIALGGRLHGATRDVPRGAAGYLELPLLLRRILHDPPAAPLTATTVAHLAAAMGLGHARINSDGALIDANDALTAFIPRLDDEEATGELQGGPVTWTGDVGVLPKARVQGRSVRAALIRVGAEQHLLLACDGSPANNSAQTRVHPSEIYGPFIEVNRYADLLGSSLQNVDDPRLRELVANLIDATARASAIVSEGESRSAAGCQTGSVGAALNAATGELAPLLQQRRVTVHTGELPTVSMGESSLKTLFKGILQHTIAYHASPSVSVSISAKRREGDWLLRLQTPDANVPRLDDTPPERNPHSNSSSSIFLCRSIVERHGGRLWIESGAAGAEVLFTVPELTAGASNSAQSKPSTGNARLGQGTAAIALSSPPTDHSDASVNTAKDAVSAAAAASLDDPATPSRGPRRYDMTQPLSDEQQSPAQGAATTEVWDERLAYDEDNESWGPVREQLEGEADATPASQTLEDDWAAIVDGLQSTKSNV